MYKTLSFYFIISFLTISSHQNRNILEGITQMCPTKQELLQKDDQTSLDLGENSEQFEIKLTKKETKHFALGTYGYVFSFKSFETIEDNKNYSIKAVKTVTVSEDSSQFLDHGQQKMFLNELNNSKIANSLDPNNLYFSKFDGCVEVTEDFKNLTKDQNTENITYVAETPKTASFLYYTEKFQSDLKSMALGFKQKKKNVFTQIGRINIAINTFKGVILMNSQFIHCSLSSNTIMLKPVTPNRAKTLYEHNVSSIEPHPAFFYQSFINDFGMSVPKDEKCIGGAYGFIPPEFFTGESHEMFDVFSAALVMIDMELIGQGFEELSQILEVSQKLKYEGKDSMEDYKKSLNRLTLIQKIKDILDDPHFVDQIRETARMFNPQIDNEISILQLEHNLDSKKLSPLLITTPSIYEALVMSAMKFFCQVPEFTQTNEDKMIMITLTIEKLKNEINQGLDIDNNNIKIQQEEASNRIQIAMKQLRKDYYSVLYNMILQKSMRKSLEDGLSEIQQILTQYLNTNQADLKINDMNRVMKSKKYLTELKKKDSEDEPLYSEEIIQTIFEDREKRMPLIYSHDRLIL